MMHNIAVYCPYHKQAGSSQSGGENTSGSDGKAVAGSSVASSSGVVLNSGVPGASTSSHAPPAKRQRVDPDTSGAEHGLAADTAPAIFCTWEGSYGDLLAKHLPTDCQFHSSSCQYGCGALVKRSDLRLHETKHCPSLLQTCTICGHRVSIANMQAHREEFAAIHANFLEKRNDELEKWNKDLSTQVQNLSTTLSGLMGANQDPHLLTRTFCAYILPQLQALNGTSTTATKEDVAAIIQKLNHKLGKADNIVVSKLDKATNHLENAITMWSG